MRKLTGPWLVMITATLILVPLIAYKGDVQGNLTAAPTGAKEDSHWFPPAINARAVERVSQTVPSSGDCGVMTHAEAPSSLLTLRQATFDLPGKHETLIRAVRYPDLQVSDDCGSKSYRLIETPFSGYFHLVDARLRHRGPPSSPAVL
jgi:hypothetical protein